MTQLYIFNLCLAVVQEAFKGFSILLEEMKIMSEQVAQTKQAIADARAAAGAENVEVRERLTALENQIAELIKTLAEGGKPEDFQEMQAELASLKLDIEGVYTPDVPPVEELPQAGSVTQAPR